MMHQHPMPLSSTRVLLVLQPLWCQQCHPHPHSMPFLNLKAAAQQSLLLLKRSMSVSETPLPLRLQTADRRALITTALQLQSCHSQLQEPKPNPVITTHTIQIQLWLLATGYCWLLATAGYHIIYYGYTAIETSEKQLHCWLQLWCNSHLVPKAITAIPPDLSCCCHP